MKPDGKVSGGRKGNRPPKIGNGAKRRISREAPLQQAAVKYLRQRKRYVGDVQFCHVPNEVRKGGGKDRAVRNEIARKKAEGLTPGAPDLIVWLAMGAVLSIELKFGATAQSASQQEFEEGLTRVAHPYVLLRAKEAGEVGPALHRMIEELQPMETVPFGMLGWVEGDRVAVSGGEVVQATQD